MHTFHFLIFFFSNCVYKLKIIMKRERERERERSVHLQYHSMSKWKKNCLEERPVQTFAGQRKME